MAWPRCAGWSVRRAERVSKRARRSSGRRAGQQPASGLRISPGRFGSEVLDWWGRDSLAETRASMLFFPSRAIFARHGRPGDIASSPPNIPVFLHLRPLTISYRTVSDSWRAPCCPSAGGSPTPNESALRKVAPALSSRGFNVSRGAWSSLETLPRRQSNDAASLGRSGDPSLRLRCGQSLLPTRKADIRQSRTCHGGPPTLQR